MKEADNVTLVSVTKRKQFSNCDCLLLNAFNISDPDSSVGVATRYVLERPGCGHRFEAGFFVSIQTGPEVHPASYTVDTGYFYRVKAAGAWH